MRKYVKTLGAILLVTSGIIAVVLVFVRFYTGHSDPLVKVPEIEGKDVAEAIQILEDGGFAYEITDTVYHSKLPLLSIVDQNPEAGFEVKEGRKVFLVLNSDVIPSVPMPNLAGKASFEQALTILRNRGLVLGKKREVPMAEIKDRNSEPVIEQLYAGTDKVIRPGTMIQKHSRVDLVVGIMIDRNLGIDSVLVEDKALMKLP